MSNLTKLLLCGSVVVVAGCGSAAASSGAAGTPTPSATRGAGGGTAGQLVRVNGNSLTLSTTTGDVSVDYTSSTAIISTSTGSTGDIVAGTCVVIGGQKDSTGQVTATSVRLTQPVNGSCSLTGGQRGTPGPGATRPSPPAGAPTLNPNAACGSGMVSAVSGDVVTVTLASGTTTSVTVPTTLSVTESAPATPGALVVDSCVRAVGSKDSSGIVQARSLTIQPADSTGACTFGRGGFGGFGGGGGFRGAPPTAAS